MGWKGWDHAACKPCYERAGFKRSMCSAGADDEHASSAQRVRVVEDLEDRMREIEDEMDRAEIVSRHALGLSEG